MKFNGNKNSKCVFSLLVLLFSHELVAADFALSDVVCSSPQVKSDFSNHVKQTLNSFKTTGCSSFNDINVYGVSSSKNFNARDRSNFDVTDSVNLVNLDSITLKNVKSSRAGSQIKVTCYVFVQASSPYQECMNLSENITKDYFFDLAKK